MKFIYVAATGASDATRASIPFHIAANGSLEVGHDTAVVLAGDGADLILGDTPEKLEGLGLPPLRDLIAKLKEHSVPVYVWKACAVARGATDESLGVVDGKWLTPPEFAQMCAEADKVLTF